MFFAKILSAFAFAATALAVAVKRDAACSWVLTPSGVPTTSLEGEVNYAVGRSLAIALGSGVAIDGPGSVVTDNGDGTISALTEYSAEGHTDAEVAAVLEGFDQTVLDGFSVNWTVNSVECD